MNPIMTNNNLFLNLKDQWIITIRYVNYSWKMSRQILTDAISYDELTCCIFIDLEYSRVYILLFEKLHFSYPQSHLSCLIFLTLGFRVMSGWVITQLLDWGEYCTTYLTFMLLLWRSSHEWVRALYYLSSVASLRIFLF